MRASRLTVFVVFFFICVQSSRGLVSFSALHTQIQSVRYRLDIMETRSRTRVRARSSPLREVTEGGTPPVSDEFVGQPSSAIGLSGDGKVSSRATSVETGPRSVSRPVVCSESVGQERGPVQGAENEEIRGFVGTACSDVISIFHHRRTADFYTL